MKKNPSILLAILFMAAQLQAQLEPNAGTWKTWFITSGKDYRLTAPTSYKKEIAEVLAAQQTLDSAGRQQMMFWSTGAPGYRWKDMIFSLWMSGGNPNGALANMLFGTATYDATIVAWDTKYAYKRPRPYTADSRIKAFVPKSESPSYPCEYAVAAGVAATLIGHFYPALADSVHRMAQQVLASRVAAGAAFPSDARAGFELGKRIAEKEIEYTKDFITKETWDGKIPDGPGLWNGKFALSPLAGKNKTVVLENGKQFRPPPPPDFANDMAELKNFKQTYRSQSNAFYFAGGFGEEVLDKKLFEYNLHLNPPRAARIYAIDAIGMYDGFVACWDAKYAYWGIRPDQYDPTYNPLLGSPPFPGYPSGHAALSGLSADLYSYFFPADRDYFQQRAVDAAESRFQGGIHFRTDNDVALVLGRKVAAVIIERARKDGSDEL